MRADELQELIVEQRALERWTGEGGLATDRFGVMASIDKKLEALNREANHRAADSRGIKRETGQPPILH